MAASETLQPLHIEASPHSWDVGAFRSEKGSACCQRPVPLAEINRVYSFSLPTSVKLAFLQELAHGSYKVLDSSAGKTKWDVETGVFEHSSRWSCAAPCPGEKLSLVFFTRDCLHLAAPRQSDLPPVIREGFRLDYLTSQLLPACLLLHLHTGEPYVRRMGGQWPGEPSLEGSLMMWCYNYSGCLSLSLEPGFRG